MNNPDKTIVRLDDIPQGMSEAQEHAFWKTHELASTLFHADTPQPSSDEEVTLSFTKEELEALKAFAKRHNKHYARVIKEAALALTKAA